MSDAASTVHQRRVSDAASTVHQRRVSDDAASTVHQRRVRDAASMTCAVFVVLLPLVVVGCESLPVDGGSAPAARFSWPSLATAEDPIEPIPLTVALDPRKVELGRALFADPVLSSDGSRTCATCHVLSEGGVVAGEARSNHPTTEAGPYNVPTVFNVAFNARFNWTGRFATLEAHLRGLLMNQEVMKAGTWDQLLRRVRRRYERRFLDAGYAALDEATLTDALASYERSLITPSSRFDRHLRGEPVLDEDELEGYALFKSIGCISCHQGMNVGGNLFQRFGVMEDAFHGRTPIERDMGRFLLTGRSDDVHVFRVPSLRNVAVTSPYFHDGSARTLDQAITHMALVQLGYRLPDADVARIAAFLQTLTGEYEGRSVDELGR